MANFKRRKANSQKHKGCGLCDIDKRAGNGASRRPASDRRRLEAMAAQV